MSALAHLEHVVAGRAEALVQRATGQVSRRRVGTESAGELRSDHRPFRTPTVLQIEAVECGAASLGMVLAYYGRWVPLTELRRACGVSRDGSKGVHIASAARSYGLDAHPARLEPADLGSLGGPAILWWRFNHFVVFEGFLRGRAQINDPASGRRLVAPDELDAAFTGIAITFEPSSEFRRGGHRYRVVDALSARTRPVRDGFALALVAGILTAVPGVVVPALTGLFVDEVLVAGERSLTWVLVGGVVAATLFQVGVSWLQQWQLLRVQSAMAVSSGAQFLWRILRLPLQFFGLRSVADVARRMGANTTVAQLIRVQLSSLGVGVVTAIVYGTVMVLYSWSLALIVFGINAVNALALRAVLVRRQTANRRLYQERTALAATTYNGVRSIETLQATSSEADYFSRWAGQQARVVNVENELAPPTVVLGAVPPAITALSLAAIVIVGGLQVIDGSISIGDLVAFQSLTVGFTAPINRVVNAAGSIQDIDSQLQRLRDVLAEPVDSAFRPDGEAGDDRGAERLSGTIELDDVTFGYSTLEPPLIDRLSLRIGPGERVALVGASGAGKTTIVRLVAGLLEPWTGSVRFDGEDRRSIRREVLANSFAVVEQNGPLFAGTVRQNVTLWDRSIPMSAIVAAARAAQIDDEIARRPGGYDTVIDEGGQNWSGGERQRLQLARALARRPTMLVLDEATSALDPLTEVEVDRAIRQLGVSSLIVAHRLSTIRDADEIIVLDHGSVVERGTHDELMARGGAYARLVGAGGDVGE